MNNNRWSCVYLLVILFARTSAVYKRWLPDTNFDNPDNWNLKRTPCGNDVAIIPDDSPIVYVQLNTSIKELHLPKNGELILGRNMALGFTETAVAGCEEASGVHSRQPQTLAEPRQLVYGAHRTGRTCDRTQSILDVQKVPCSYDDVIFPRDHAYFVDLTEDTPMLSVKTLKISGTTFTTYSFTNYLNSAEGEKMFRWSPSGSRVDRVNITRTNCEDPRGCACGNDRPQIAKAVCSHVEKSCFRPRCSQTVQPVGACCKMCGAVFNITRGYGFNFNSFVSSLKSKFLSGGVSRRVTQDGVNVTFSLTSEGWVQVALNDVTGEKSSSLAKLLQTEFNNDLASGGHTYAIDAVRLSFATDTSEPAHSAQRAEPMTSGSIAGIVVGVIAVIIVVIIVVVVFIFRRTGRELPVIKMPSIHLPAMPTMPSLPRWGPRLRAGPSPGLSQPHTAPHVDPGFANPLYDTSPFDDGNYHMKEMELIGTSLEEQPTFDVSEGGFHNPLYGTAGVSPYMFSDPSSVEEPSAEAPIKRKIGAATSSPPPAKTTISIEHPSSEKGDSTI
ncbi:unnamed protein product [Candidula unifasciata]|uniref:Protein amnionless n=1 Tax=Candidula unifasciata TaxID=100452 RepID=A0A8S3ZZS4_9EUPU|nr:unnamed protein product [Candidula unifasciata]